MPFLCKFCQGRYCAAHRLPENHQCVGLTEYRQRARAEGRLLAPEPGEPLRAEVSAGAGLGAAYQRLRMRAEGHLAMVFLVLMLGAFVLQIVLGASGLVGLERALFVLERDTVLTRPWTLVTSIFAHGGTFHLGLNALALYFVGPTLEGLLGSRRFALLFLGSGVLGGAGELALSTLPVFYHDAGVVGASGAIFGLLGTLTILAPELTVLLFFVLPVRLWILTALFAVINFAGAFSGSGIAELAHLSGLAVGLAYGKHLYDRGLRAYVRQPEPPHRRPF